MSTKFTKEMVDDYADKLLIGLTAEENQMVLDEFSVIDESINVINNIKDGDIVLFHDSYDSTVLAISELLPILYSKGYQVMSVSELANIKNVTLEEFQLYRKIV